MRIGIKPLLVIFLFISLLIFFFRNFLPLQMLQGFIQNIFAFPMNVLYGLKVGNQNTNSEIDRLRTENKKLTEKLVEFEIFKKDNVALRSQYDEKSLSEHSLIASQVIGSSTRYGSIDSLVIDKGVNDGLQEGMAVVSGKNLVGVLDRVSQQASRIKLVTHEDFSTVGISLETGANGVVEGVEEFMVFGNVTIKEILKIGDIIISKGSVNEKNIGIPPDLIIGRIVNINKSENKPLQDSKLEPMLDFERLRIVFVIGDKNAN